jgi:hypothetical protein
MRMAREKRSVEQMLERERPFHEIEATIEGFGALTEEQRAALWLLAWTEMDIGTHRRIAKEAILVTSRPGD